MIINIMIIMFMIIIFSLCYDYEYYYKNIIKYSVKLFFYYFLKVKQ